MNKNLPIKKNEEYIVDIIDNGFESEGIAKINDFTVFIPGVIKGERVKVLIVKVLTSYAFGKVIEYIKKSEYRQEVDCCTYKRCGGCNMRHITYEHTLKMKQNAVQSLVNKTLKNKLIVKETIGMDNPYNYRNKAQYPLGLDKNNEPIVGVFANRSHDIIPVEKCFIQKSVSEDISKYMLELIKENKISIYDEKTKKGLFRHIVIKVGVKTDEIMVVFVINGDKFPNEEKITKQIIEKFHNVKTVVKNINKKNTNVIMGDKNIVLFGKGYIEDTLGEFTFKISPMSFYQINPIQAEKLYNIGVKGANITSSDIVFDLYCGIGTISIFMAKYAKKVYGVEIVEQAVEDAKENAKINNIDNVEFIAGDTEIVLDDLINNKKIIPDVVMIDPPRKGLDNKSVENIIKIHPKKFVYISCNPATMVRDLAKLEEIYEITEIQPVDMFPFTSHIETIAVLKLK